MEKLKQTLTRVQIKFTNTMRKRRFKLRGHLRRMDEKRITKNIELH